ncbi:MAG TPA: hypothetical protein VMH28_23935 [Candidatus Acidoferrales bacterium]|nr:hypothetical protein [Candidatus Acidoferrales bacterium]
MRRLAFVLAAAASFSMLKAAAPDGWFTAGSAPQSYAVSTDNSVTYLGSPSVRLAPAAANPPGFVTVMQQFLPDHYKGKRVRFSGFVKANGVQGWAGLWMRIDVGNLLGGFDNMQGRPIAGTSDWTPYSVVLDVAQSATAINFGILLNGAGTVWLSGVRFEVVDTAVPVTDIVKTPYEPANLGFQPKSPDATDSSGDSSGQ